MLKKLYRKIFKKPKELFYKKLGIKMGTISVCRALELSIKKLESYTTLNGIEQKDIFLLQINFNYMQKENIRKNRGSFNVDISIGYWK